MKKLSLILLISYLVVQALPGVITATYTPAPVVFFKLGHEMTTPNTPLGTFPSSDMVGYLGTLVITKEPGDNNYYHPKMVSHDSTNNFYFEGNLRYKNSIVFGTTSFRVAIKHSMSSQFINFYMQGGGEALLGWGGGGPEVTVNPFVVDFFIVSWENSSVFIKDETYTLIEGHLGRFNVTIAKNSNQTITEYISVNGQDIPPGGGVPEDPPIPIVIGGEGAPLPDVPYGEEPLPLMFQIDIIKYSPFNLNQAYSNTGVKVATTIITVVNGQEGQNYNLKIKFTNPQQSPNFSLRPENNTDGYSIPYRLRFGTENWVKGGTLYDWKDLTFNGQNSKDIYVYDVDEFVARNAPAGTFEDTILVEIYNAD